MIEPEDFLARWSRRKREAAAEQDRPEPEKPESAAEGDKPATEETGESPRVVRNKAEGETAAVSFDLSKLPSLDSITAETDIRPFLAAGVPAHLTKAALRRVWSADPKIRDFIEIAENQWDFNAGAVPGFDLSPPANAQKMVADIFGQLSKVEENADLSHGDAHKDSAPAQSSVSYEPAAAAEMHQTESEAPAKADSASSEKNEIGHKTAQSEAAPQQQQETRDEIPVLPRRHGSALPS